MIRSSIKSFEQAMKAPWWKRFKGGLDENKFDYAQSNSFMQKAASADDKFDVPIYQVDSDNVLRLGEQANVPMKGTLNFPLNTTASISTQAFFIAPVALTITGISCFFDVKNGVAATGKITKDRSGVVPGAGTSMQVGTFDLDGTARTVQNATVPNYSSGDPRVLTMAAGDRLSFKLASGSVSALAGLVITVYVTPSAKGHMATYVMDATGDIIAASTFFLANRRFTAQKVMMCWSAVPTDLGAVTGDVICDTSTNAPGAGTTILSAAKSLKTTINVPVTCDLTATIPNRNMLTGDRLAFKITGVTTALAGVVVVVWFTSHYDRKEVTFALAKNANIATQPFFIADRDYEVIDSSCVYPTAAGGALKIGVTLEGSTTAAGSGLMSQTDNTNAGFDINTTLNTVQVGTMATLRNRILVAGGRMSIKLSSTVQSTAGLCITVSLRPRS